MSATSRMKQTQVRLLNDLAIIIVILKQDVDIIVEINLFYERWLIGWNVAEQNLYYLKGPNLEIVKRRTECIYNRVII